MKYLFPRLVGRSARFAALTGLAAIAPLAVAGSNAQLSGQIQQDSPLLLHGSSSVGYLGVDLRDVDSKRAAALKLKDVRGAEITTVDHDAPAGKAGLRVHDVILQMNGQTIEGEEQLRRMLRETPAGRTVTFLISRGGQQQTVIVQLEDRAEVEAKAWSQHYAVPDPDSSSSSGGVFSPAERFFGNGFFGVFGVGDLYTGLEVDTLGTQLADYFGVHDGAGLLVKRVEDNSPGSTAGLKAGDVITRVNGSAVATVSQWTRVLHANRGKQVQLTVVRNRKEQSVSMQAGDAKKKGELAPFPFALDPETEASLQELQDRLAQMAPGLADQVLQSMQGIDANGLRDELENSLQAARPQMEQLRKQLEQQNQQLDRLREQMKNFRFPDLN